MQLKPGDLLTKPVRGMPLFTHYGLCLGYRYDDWDGWQYALDIKKVRQDLARVRILRVSEFFRDAQVSVEPGPDGVDPRVLWSQALQLRRQRWVKYSLLNVNGVNCESLARFVQAGERRSVQVDSFVTGAALALGAAVLYCGTPIVAEALFGPPTPQRA